MKETLSETLARFQSLLPFFSLAEGYPDWPKNGVIPPILTDPNYVAPSRAGELNAVVAAMTALATIVVSMRLYMTCTMPGMRMGLEDWAMIPSIILLLTYSSLVFVITTRSCVGLHAYDCNLDQIRLGWALNVPLVAVYIFQVYFTKLSNLFFIRRIAPPELTWTRNLVYGFFVFHTVWTLVSALMDSFLCTPVRANYNLDVRIKGAKCLNQWAFTLALNILFVLSDFAFLLLPIGILRKMKLPRRTKFGIAFLFFLGLLTCAASLAKLRYFDVYYKTWDATWGVVDELKWSVTECSLLIITVSLPTMDPWLVKLIPNRLREKLRQHDEQDEEKRRALVVGDSIVLHEKRVVSMDKMMFAATLDPRTNPNNHLASPALQHSRSQADISSTSTPTKGEFRSHLTSISSSNDERTTISGMSASHTYATTTRSPLSPELASQNTNSRGLSWFDFDE